MPECTACWLRRTMKVGGRIQPRNPVRSAGGFARPDDLPNGKESNEVSSNLYRHHPEIGHVPFAVVHRGRNLPRLALI